MPLRIRQEIQTVPRSPDLTAADADSSIVDVIVGVIADSAGRILIARRPDGTHMAGSWEFPGGKLEYGEGALDALKRELAEELGIRVESAEPLVELCHRYPDRHVRLDVWWVVEYTGEVEAREGQVLRWVDSTGLSEVPLLPADAPVVSAIRKRFA